MMKFDVRSLVGVVYLAFYLTQSVAVRTEVGVAITAEKVNTTGKEGMVQRGVEVAYVVGGQSIQGISYGIVSVVDVTTNMITTTIPMGQIGYYPEEVVVVPDETRAYVRNRMIEVIDTATNGILAKIPISIYSLKLAISPDETRAYVTDLSTFGDLVTIDIATSQVISTISIGNRPAGMVVSPDGTRVYVITDDGNVHIIDTATNRVVVKIKVGYAPSGILVTPDGSLVYVINNPMTSAFGNHNVWVIDTVTSEVVSIIPVGTPRGVEPSMVITPDGTRVYVSACITSGSILLFIDTATNEVTDKLILSTFYAAYPGEMILSPDGAQICIVCSEGIWIVDTETKQLVGTILMNRPNRIAFTSDGTKIYGIGYVASSIYGISRVDMIAHDVTYTSVNFTPQAIAIVRINQ
jgi:YVTN family beta-propeller protein